MPTTASEQQLRADFDAIAALTPRRPANDAEAWIVAHLPQSRTAALDAGCGVGDLARSLAAHFARVDAIDLSEGMIAEAIRRTSKAGSVAFACADLFAWLRERPESYDCIVSVATLHHVELEDALLAMRDALRPGGRLLVVDLVDRSGSRHFFTNVIAHALTAIRVAFAMLRGRTSWKLRRAYDHHGHNETYLTLAEVRRIAAACIPGAEVTATLFWRYRLLWEKGVSRSSSRSTAASPTRGATRR